MHFSAEITGFPVEADYSDAFVNEIAIPLLKKWTSLQRSLDRRIIIFLAAPPAAGKSTMSAFLEQLSHSIRDITPIESAGMDGFHRYQDFLVSHSMVRNGVEVPMVAYKGAPETFDLDALKERLSRLKNDPACPWPVYDRRTHNPAEGLLTLKGSIVLIEGNYLLLDLPGWKELASLADDTVHICAEPALLYDRLLERKLKTVPDHEKAEKFVIESDLYNARTILAHPIPANTTLRLQEDGEYTLMG